VLEELELLRLELVVAVLDDVLLRLDVVVLLVLVDDLVELVLLPEVRLDAAVFDMELPLGGCDEVAREAPEAPVDPDDTAVLLRDPEASEADACEELLSPNPPAGSGDVPQPGITMSAAQTRPRPLLDTRMLIARSSTTRASRRL
jgi:hypothetical protein